MTTSRIAAHTAHRPWPLPADPWLMFQSWQNLLFAHWPLPAAQLRPLIPPQLELETFDGTAWIGLTPFLLADLHPRLLPPLPGLSTFPEMNLRTYVRVRERPGIFFFSLDAASRFAVIAARTFYRLPYHFAEMSIQRNGDEFRYHSRRVENGAAFEGRYRPTGDPAVAPRESIEAFLVERYALYTVLRSGRVLRGDIHHLPWPLQTAEADIEHVSVPAAHGIQLPDVPPLLHFAGRLDTLIWAPKLLD